MKRYLPLIGVLSVLVVGGLITAVVAGAAAGGGSGDGEDGGRQADVAGMCAPGVVDCDDMIEPGDDPAGSACLAGATDCADDPSSGQTARCISPDNPGAVIAECNDTFDCTADPEACVAVDPICIDDGSGECADSIDGMDPRECTAGGGESCQGVVPSGPVTLYDLTIGFNESVTQTDLEEIGETVEEIAPGSEFLVRESFPPVGAARVATSMLSFCADIEAKFESLPYVTDVSCAVAADAAPGDPDEPVSSEPGVAPDDPGSSE